MEIICISSAVVCQIVQIIGSLVCADFQHVLRSLSAQLSNMTVNQVMQKVCMRWLTVCVVFSVCTEKKSRLWGTIVNIMNKAQMKH